MCDCKIVCVEPTCETSWGIRDNYVIKCETCKTTILKGTLDEISDYILINKCIVESGEKYLPIKVLDELRQYMEARV
jgi:hypothetical protein